MASHMALMNLPRDKDVKKNTGLLLGKFIKIT